MRENQLGSLFFAELECPWEYNDYNGRYLTFIILFDYDISVLVLLGLLWCRNNGKILLLFLRTKANYGSGLRAAVTHHANEGVSVK